MIFQSAENPTALRPFYRGGMAKPRPRTRDVFARNLSWLLHERQWSQRDLAQRSGVSQRQISNIVTGKMAPTIETADALAEAFGLPGWILLNADMPTDLLETPSLRKLVAGWIKASDEDRAYLDRVSAQAAKYSKK